MSRTGGRYYRTILVGLVALAGLVWMAIDQFAVPGREVRGLFLACVLVIGAVVVCAAVCAAAWIALRKLVQRDEQE